MAAIALRVKNNLYSISMDNNEWTELTVNGENVPQAPGGGWSWSQSEEGPVKFTATANLVTTVNPGPDMLVLDGDNNTHVALLRYSLPGMKPFSIDGFMMNGTAASAGPLGFSQGMMTGNFENA